MVSMLHLVERAEMKKSLEPKKEYFHSETKATTGTLSAKGQNFGTYTIQERMQESPSESSLFQIGLN